MSTASLRRTLLDLGLPTEAIASVMPYVNGMDDLDLIETFEDLRDVGLNAPLIVATIPRVMRFREGSIDLRLAVLSNFAIAVEDVNNAPLLLAANPSDADARLENLTARSIDARTVAIGAPGILEQPRGLTSQRLNDLLWVGLFPKGIAETRPEVLLSLQDRETLQLIIRHLNSLGVDPIAVLSAEPRICTLPFEIVRRNSFAIGHAGVDARGVIAAHPGVLLAHPKNAAQMVRALTIGGLDGIAFINEHPEVLLSKPSQVDQIIRMLQAAKVDVEALAAAVPNLLTDATDTYQHLKALQYAKVDLPQATDKTRALLAVSVDNIHEIIEILQRFSGPKAAVSASAELLLVDPAVLEDRLNLMMDLRLDVARMARRRPELFLDGNGSIEQVLAAKEAEGIGIAELRRDSSKLFPQPSAPSPQAVRPVAAARSGVKGQGMNLTGLDMTRVRSGLKGQRVLSDHAISLRMQNLQAMGLDAVRVINHSPHLLTWRPSVIEKQLRLLDSLGVNGAQIASQHPTAIEDREIGEKLEILSRLERRDEAMQAIQSGDGSMFDIPVHTMLYVYFRAPQALEADPLQCNALIKAWGFGSHVEVLTEVRTLLGALDAPADEDFVSAVSGFIDVVPTLAKPSRRAEATLPSSC